MDGRTAAEVSRLELSIWSLEFNLIGFNISLLCQPLEESCPFKILVAITPVYAFVHRVKQKQNQKETERSILKQKRSLLHNGGGFGCTRSDICFRSRKKTDQIWHQKKIRSPEAKTNHSRLKSLASQFKHHLVVSCSIKRPDMMTKIQVNALNLYCFVSNVP